MATKRDTIVALSSTARVSARPESKNKADLTNAIIRLSGREAVSLAARVFKPELVKDTLAEIKGWRRIKGHVLWQAHSLSAAVYVMRSPRSYTREDVVELHIPALPWLSSGLLEALIAAGSRMAEPGEFTRRAFENGRITLEQAEAIGALIASRNAGEARVQAARLRSHSHTKRKSLRDEIEELLSLVELGLDFSQEDAGVLSVEEILTRLEALLKQAEAMHAGGDSKSLNADAGVRDSGLPRVLLLGPTNAGKSTLFNKLLGREAAIVSGLRHTTRDIVEAELMLALHGAPQPFGVLLQDSAGWGSEIEIESQTVPAGDAATLRLAAWNQTAVAIRSADTILLVLDGTAPPDTHEMAAFKSALAHAKAGTLAVVWTKMDLNAANHNRGINAAWLAGSGLSLRHAFEISSVTGAGLPALREFIAAQAEQMGSRRRDADISANAVARTSAQTAAAALQRAYEGLKSGHGEDVVAVELREALHAFWQAEGVLVRHDAVTEAALDRIFSQFCIGK